MAEKINPEELKDNRLKPKRLTKNANFLYVLILSIGAAFLLVGGFGTHPDTSFVPTNGYEVLDVAGPGGQRSLQLRTPLFVTSTPRPTNTPAPTSTPKPTPTAGPTPTKGPSPTPRPTSTPRPTATPGPPPTPKPTSTPKPTNTPLPPKPF